MTPQSGTPSPLARFPIEVQTAFARYQHTRQAADLSAVLNAVLLDFMPKHVKTRLSGPIQAEQRLFDDLGFDSLTVAETVFFFEDLLGVTIQNQEIMTLQTVADLEAFVARKISEMK